MADGISAVTETTFTALVEGSGQPVLADFRAPWCGPCKAMAPLLQELAGDFAREMVFIQCDIDGNPELTRRFGVRSIPTLLFFRNGEPVERLNGAVDRETLLEAVHKVLAGEKPVPPLIVQ